MGGRLTPCVLEEDMPRLPCAAPPTTFLQLQLHRLRCNSTAYNPAYSDGYNVVGYNPEFPSVNSTVGSSNYYQNQQTRRTLFAQNRPNNGRNNKFVSRSTKAKATFPVKGPKKQNKTKSAVAAQRSATESSSSSSQFCKAEDTPQGTDDQKPGRIRGASPGQPDISVLKIISPKKNNKQPRKSQAGGSATGTRRGAPGSTTAGMVAYLIDKKRET
ncbi:unnamed protein product [Heligmosomoides polygyrus]|uniref:Uncharacterized protein n=1 Tax=Heligmosomoides polygyrus TaxID=6339 RepID=A0A3P7Z2Y1_HELPZ|nr:unnamed protein product [Heligmosomoides polygyrus]